MQPPEEPTGIPNDAPRAHVPVGAPSADPGAGGSGTHSPRSRRRKKHGDVPTAALLDALSDGFIVVDGQDVVRYVNAAVEQVLGRPRAQLVGQPVWDAFPEALGMPFFLHYYRVLSDGVPAQFEVHYPPRDIWLEARLSPLDDGGVAADLWDITGRKQLEARLRAGEERFRVTFEQAAIGMVHGSLDGRQIRVNDRFCALVGRTRDEVLEHSYRDFTHPDDIETDAALARRLVAGEIETYSLEKRYLRPDGSVVWGSLTMSLARNDDGMPAYFIAAVEDITERKRLEAEVSARAAQLQAIFDTIADAVYVFDAQGDIADANTAALRQLTGPIVAFNARPPEERNVPYGPRDERGRPLARAEMPITRLLRGEALTGDAVADMTVTLPDGRERELNVSGAPLLDGRGALVGAVAVTRDVTERRRLERQRMDLLNAVTHDLGNPLSAAKLALQSFRKREEAETALAGLLGRPEASKLPDVLDYAISRMERLVGDLNTAIKLDTAGELALRSEHFDLAEVCRREVGLLRDATGRIVVLDTATEHVDVVADPDAVGRTITNLLSNADKYSPFDHPIVLTLMFDVAGWPRVAVHDEGPGIPLAERQRIWEQFHRVPGIEARDIAGGLGLGLAICRGIIEQLGGHIDVESEVGVGSTFWFTLPPPPPGPVDL